MNSPVIVAIGIFGISMLAITTEKVNKTAAALFGAMLMVVFGVVTQEKAFDYIDWNVIFLLIGMMIITGITKRTGLFQYIAIRLAKFARGEPLAIILLLALATALVSAVLDNVTTVLILVPITFLIAVELNVVPTPFVIVLAIASNVGGTATLVGDPPNIMIGSAAGLGFVDFLANTAPVIVLILAALCLFVFVVFRKSLVVSNERKARIMAFDDSKAIEDKPLLAKSLVVLGLVIGAFLFHSAVGLEPATIALGGAALLLILSGFHDVEAIFGEIEWTTIMFFLGLEPATIALGGAGLLMVISGYKEVEELFAELEWTTIIFFMGLFMIVGALVEVGVMKSLAQALLGATAGHLKLTGFVVLWASGILSAFVDNIPFVATMIPLIKEMSASLGPQAVEPLWWALSLGACLGGNG
ncbi:MAG: ArsB/NhaD family transporter, partial [Spirochaetaceae bacterium]|nr:ArsB/NhaD family transporter [Spirochaetaceae bacterium]